MKTGRMSLRHWVGWTGLGIVLLLATALAIWRGDILQAGLDPQVPFQTYTPPPAPDYGSPAAWALLDVRGPGSGPAAVFFVHPTTHDGGREWNGPIGDPEADAWLERVVLPNYAGPFARAGAISAPRYRQGSLYTRLTLRDDAREARAFAWRDIAAAFDVWIARHPDGPIVLAGVEQGGDLVERLVRERVAGDPALRARLVAVYLVDVVAAVDYLTVEVPACASRAQAGCIVAWSPVSEGNDGAGQRRLRRASPAINPIPGLGRAGPAGRSRGPGGLVRQPGDRLDRHRPGRGAPASGGDQCHRPRMGCSPGPDGPRDRHPVPRRPAAPHRAEDRVLPRNRQLGSSQKVTTLQSILWRY